MEHGKEDLSEKELKLILDNSTTDTSLLVDIANSRNSKNLFRSLIAHAIGDDDWKSGGAMPIVAEKAVGDREIYTLLAQNNHLEFGTAEEMIPHLNARDDIDILIQIRDHPNVGDVTSINARKKIHRLHSIELNQKCTDLHCCPV